MATFSDLPLDILVLIFPYLEPADFLNLCSTCKALSEPVTRHEPSFWRYQTQSKFRVPNRPAVHTDGLHWQNLYKKLQTQSRVYTWGQNTHGCLGRNTTDQTYGMQPRRGPQLRPRIVGQPLSQQKSTWPEEMSRARNIGIISDLQCGGWSTSLLTAKGVIYSVGVLDGMKQWNPRDELTPLSFDAINNELPKAHTAIKQFSSGRKHVLGLSDDGTIWSWADATRPATQISLVGIDEPVVGVHAGWDRSAALIRGVGIVLWDTPAPMVVNAEIHDHVVVPRTSFHQQVSKAKTPRGEAADDNGVGEIKSYTVLEHYVLFTTHLRKVFAYRNRYDASSGVIHDIFELTELTEAKDVQGSFRKFAVFLGEGRVLIGDQEYLDACAQRAFQQTEDPLPEIMVIPAMQNTGVMQVAFGDYHYHALHSDGSISSYGTEPGSCGALGLGGAMDVAMPHGALRGIKSNPWNFDGVLQPHCYTNGRRVWFHKEQEALVRFMAGGGKDPEEAKDRMRQVNTTMVAQACVSEWIEQMGSGWDQLPEVQKVDEDGLGSYFALTVSAAGWHSGALVLVNDKVVKAVRKSCLQNIKIETSEGEEPVPGRRRASSLWDVARNFLGLQLADDSSSEAGSEGTSDQDQHQDSNDPLLPPPGKRWRWTNWDFPRLRLDYGFQTPGSIDFTEWKELRPDWRFFWTGDERKKLFGVPGWIDEDTEPIEGP